MSHLPAHTRRRQIPGAARTQRWYGADLPPSTSPMHPTAQAAARRQRREQFRLTRLGLLNWGTVAGLHEVPIAPDGFLIVGRRL
jgi:hypothetical protein